MRYLLSALKSIIYSLLLLFILLGALLAFLLTTTPGLYVGIKLASSLLPGKLQVEKIDGHFIDHFSFGHLSYHTDTLYLELTDFNVTWQIKTLLHHQITIENLQAKKLQVDLNSIKTVKQTTKHHFSLPNLHFPLTINKIFINQAQITQDGVAHQLHHIGLQASLSNQQWQFNKLDFDFDNINLVGKISGQPILPHALSINLQFKNTLKKNPHIMGKFDLGGDLFLYHWHGELSKPARVTLNGTLKNGYELHTRTEWDQFVWPIDKRNTLQSTSGQIDINGKIPDLAINLISTISSPVQAELQAHAQTTRHGVNVSSTLKLSEKGSIDLSYAYNTTTTPKIKGKINAQSFDLSNSDLAIQQLKFDTRFVGDSLINLTLNSSISARYLDNWLHATIRYQQQHLNGQLTLGANQLLLTGSYPYQLQAKATIPEPKLLHPTLAGLQTSIIANASLTSATNGEMTLTIHPGHYQLPRESPLPNLLFTGGQLRARLNPQNLQLNGHLTIDQFKSMTLSLELPRFQLSRGFSDDQRIQGNMQLDVNSLAFLESLSPDIIKPQGQLRAILKTQGTLNKPVIEGHIHLDKGSLLLPRWGLDLSPIQINVQSRERRWDGQGFITANGKTLTLRGKGDFSPQVTGLINIDSDNFPLINTPEYQIHLSPKLTLEFTPASIDMRGTIVIPQAQIKPKSYENSVSLSEDVVFTGTEPPPNPLHMNTNVRLEMGNEVAINVKGLQGFLIGAINLHQLPQGPLNATGELTVRDGKYQAYGQDLTIDQGHLLFTGGSVTNPGIQVRAIRQFNNTTASFAGSNRLLDFNTANLQTLDFGNKTTVGIDVSGRLNSPKIELFSVPGNLSQADILSMLLLGRPANQANKAGGQLLLSAISSMNLDSGTGGMQLLEQLKQALGLDFNLESTPKYDEQTKQFNEKTSVVVGKSLSKRMYVSYNFGLAQGDSNVVTLTYLLNKFFSVQVNASLTGSGIDLLYTHRKE